MRPLEKSSVGAGSGKGSGNPGHLPSCLRPVTHFLQAFLTTGSGAPAFSSVPEGTQTARVLWGLPLPAQGSGLRAFSAVTLHSHLLQCL